MGRYLIQKGKDLFLFDELRLGFQNSFLRVIFTFIQLGSGELDLFMEFVNGG